MKLLSVKLSRSWLLRGISLFAILSSLLFFQNCGPGFTTDSEGRVMMSTFADPIEIPSVAPSSIVGVIPEGDKSNSKYQAKACASGVCNTKVYIGN